MGKRVTKEKVYGHVGGGHAFQRCDKDADDTRFPKMIHSRDH